MPQLLPLQIIYILILKNPQFPTKKKQSIIVAILKDDDPLVSKNYRPISISLCFYKVFDSLLHNQIYATLPLVLKPTQHEFMHDRSTVTNLGFFYVIGKVDVMYLDF